MMKFRLDLSNHYIEREIKRKYYISLNSKSIEPITKKVIVCY